MTRMSKHLGGGTRCPDCNGRGLIEYCPPRAKNNWCAQPKWCRTCNGYGYTPAPQPPTAREVVSRIVRRHEPVTISSMTDDEFTECVNECLRIGIFTTDACEIHCEGYGHWEDFPSDIEHRIDDVAEAAWERQCDTQAGLW